MYDLLYLSLNALSGRDCVVEFVEFNIGGGHLISTKSADFCVLESYDSYPVLMLININMPFLSPILNGVANVGTSLMKAYSHQCKHI